MFDPWQQTSWDTNDTCAPHDAPPDGSRPAQTGDPRTDTDIAGYVAEYFKALPDDPKKPWQTWYAKRIKGDLGPYELAAALQSAGHADTPTTVHVDALGRPIVTVIRNRVACADHPLDGRGDEETRTYATLDIQGNQREVRDERRLPDPQSLPLGPLQERVVMRWAYDMLGHRIHQVSMEGGQRWMLTMSQASLREWDSRGHNFTTTYDALRRPVQDSVVGTFSDPDPRRPNSDPRTLNPPDASGLQITKTEYGEPAPDASQADLDQALLLIFGRASIGNSIRLVS